MTNYTKLFTDPGAVVWGMMGNGVAKTFDYLMTPSSKWGDTQIFKDGTKIPLIAVPRLLVTLATPIKTLTIAAWATVKSTPMLLSNFWAQFRLILNGLTIKGEVSSTLAAVGMSLDKLSYIFLYPGARIKAFFTGLFSD
jgi:hypothetical protein